MTSGGHAAWGDGSPGLRRVGEAPQPFPEETAMYIGLGTIVIIIILLILIF
ncbi:MAG: hypothetical protein M3503_05210 [Actinomycetota bacterium]|nr:hypothetical protein [Actinomycetota bacterium]